MIRQVLLVAIAVSAVAACAPRYYGHDGYYGYHHRYYGDRYDRGHYYDRDRYDRDRYDYDRYGRY